MKIIGLTGKAGHGKTTAATMLAERIRKDGLTVEVVGFADDLKARAARLGWNGKKDKRGRWMLQTLGDDLRKAHGDKFFIDNLFGSVGDREPDVLIIHDVRFEKEAIEIQKRGGFILLVHAPRNLGENDSGSKHKSEQPLPYRLIDGTILNWSSLTYFEEECMRQLEWLRCYVYR